ncbi:MAG: sulfotransferase [Planctomycetes bacterium]|nr:sulfotransferase [Planctomycetota bacterium]
MPSEPRPLKPLLVLFPARSGSTLLMQLLGTSPQVAFDRVSPFETRYLAFYLRWAWQLAEAGQRRTHWTADQIAAERPWAGNWIEPPPFPMPDGFAVDGESPLWHHAFHTAWREFSARARRREACAPGLHPDVVWYAEKSRTPFRASLQQLGVEHEVIYLLRDPRDILQSIWAFNEKRGSIGFSVQESETQHEFAVRFLDERRRRLRVLLEMAPKDPHAVVVRYEDMIQDLPAVAARLSARYGVTFDAAQVQAQQKDFADHMSSKGPRASIGRWRREMDPSIRDLFAREVGRELAALGYEV